MENNILVDFECIYDTDFGLIKSMKNNGYTNKDIVINSLFNINNLLLVEILYTRTDENPLSLFINKNYNNSIDSLYNQFMNNYYEDILRLSHVTDILNLLQVYKKTNLINITILCKNKYQKQFINNSFNTIVSEDLSSTNVSEYDTIYIKKFKDLLSFNNLVGKSVYVANYKFNFDEDMKSLKTDIYEQLSDALKIFIIDLYNKEKFINIKG